MENQLKASCPLAFRSRHDLHACKIISKQTGSTSLFASCFPPSPPKVDFLISPRQRHWECEKVEVEGVESLGRDKEASQNQTQNQRKPVR